MRLSSGMLADYLNSHSQEISWLLAVADCEDRVITIPDMTVLKFLVGTIIIPKLSSDPFDVTYMETVTGESPGITRAYTISTKDTVAKAQQVIPPSGETRQWLSLDFLDRTS